MRILLATDGSSGAGAALDLLADLPCRSGVDRVTVLTVVPRRPAPFEPDARSLLAVETAAAETADLAARHLMARGIPADVHVGSGSPPQAIAATAAATRSDLIVVGSRGRGLIAGALLGSTARALIRSSSLPILVVRDRRRAPQRILVAVDGSRDSRAAITTFAALPLPATTEVVLMHVVPDSRIDRGWAAELLHVTARQLPPSWAMRTEVDSGDVAERVLARAAAAGTDLIVLGSRGTGVGDRPEGTTADRIISQAHCAVLVGHAPVPSASSTPTLREVSQSIA